MRSSRWLTNDSEERVLWWFTVRSLKHVTWLVGNFGKSCSFVFVYYVINSMLACKISRTFYNTKKYVRFFSFVKVIFYCCLWWNTINQSINVEEGSYFQRATSEWHAARNKLKPRTSLKNPHPIGSLSNQNEPVQKCVFNND